MKKILLSGLVSFVCAGNALADAHCSAFNGFYLGGGLNYMNEKFDRKIDVTRAGVTRSEKRSGSLKGAGLKLFGGYGALVNQGLYLGAELSVGFDRLVGSKKDADLGSNKKLNYGIAARVGYAFSTVLPYVKFGYEGRPSLKFADVVTIKRNGIILGGGIDVAVKKNLLVRAEYVHGFGGKSNFSASEGGVTGNINFKTRNDTFLLGAAYKF